jgi:hypothetical protein
MIQGPFAVRHLIGNSRHHHASDMIRPLIFVMTGGILLREEKSRWLGHVFVALTTFALDKQMSVPCCTMTTHF